MNGIHSYLWQRRPVFLVGDGANEVSSRGAKKGGRRGGDEKSPARSRSGVTEECVSLRTKMGNMPIVKRWGIRIGNYWRGFFSFFPKK
jgi:hypothetical protein